MGPLIRWHGRYPIVNVKWEDLEPLRLAVQQLKPDPLALVAGFRQSLGWTFKVLLPAIASAGVGSAVNVWVGHVFGK